jgi:hypothetical protein
MRRGQLGCQYFPAVPLLTVNFPQDVERYSLVKLTVRTGCVRWPVLSARPYVVTCRQDQREQAAIGGVDSGLDGGGIGAPA